MNTTQTSNLQTPNSIKVYNEAVVCLNKNMHGNVDPEVGCAMTVNNIFIAALGHPVGGAASTADMYTSLQDTTRFTKVAVPIAGDVIISPTGHGNGSIVGHVGIVAFYGILSNNSDNGLVQEQWKSISDWVARYAALGALPVEFYRVN